MISNPNIQTLPTTLLIGIRLTMSLADNKTAELWSSFMPRRREITNAVNTDLYSMQIYKENYFDNFNPSAN